MILSAICTLAVRHGMMDEMQSDMMVIENILKSQTSRFSFKGAFAAGYHNDANKPVRFYNHSYVMMV